MVEAEEFRKTRPLRVWAALLVLAALLVGWGFLNYSLIEDRVRVWDYGILPDAPSESAYSSTRPGAQAPLQQPRLPEATSKPMPRGAAQ